MFEALLVDRFKLAAHRETRLRPGYALVVDKNGPKFKESPPVTNAVGSPAPAKSGLARRVRQPESKP